MEHIDLRKLNSRELKQVRRQIMRLKNMRKAGKEIEESTGVWQNRISERETVPWNRRNAGFRRGHICG